MNSARDVFSTGLRLLKNGEIHQATELAAEAVLDFPDDGQLWELLGVAYQRSARYADALHALEMASLLKPLDIGARFCLAEAYAATGSLPLAVFMYRMVSEDPRTPVWLLPKVASHLGELREFEHALDVCQTIVERDTERHEAHFGIGFYLRRLGAPTERVVAAIQRAFELAPQSPLYRVVLASLLQEMDRHDDAYELLLDLPPSSVHCPHSLRRMLQVFHTASDMQRALDCSRCLRKLNNELPPATSEGTE
jgi:tetratricopeptide (TPR) repeat protein